MAHPIPRRHLFLIAAASVLMMVVGCGGGEKETLSAKSGTLTASLSSNPSPPKSGHDSSFTITLAEMGRRLRARRCGRNSSSWD